MRRGSPKLSMDLVCSECEGSIGQAEKWQLMM